MINLTLIHQCEINGTIYICFRLQLKHRKNEVAQSGDGEHSRKSSVGDVQRRATSPAKPPPSSSGRQQNIVGKYATGLAAELRKNARARELSDARGKGGAGDAGESKSDGLHSNSKPVIRSEDRNNFSDVNPNLVIHVPNKTANSGTDGKPRENLVMHVANSNFENIIVTVKVDNEKAIKQRPSVTQTEDVRAVDSPTDHRLLVDKSGDYGWPITDQRRPVDSRLDCRRPNDVALQAGTSYSTPMLIAQKAVGQSVQAPVPMPPIQLRYLPTSSSDAQSSPRPTSIAPR